ncbi:MAG: Uma2 family endonuclease [Planctomycetota bacterium]
MRLGSVLGSDAGYQCFPPDSQRVRKPDVSFISLDKIPREHAEMGYIPIAPDLAVEVVSPNDLALEIDNKVSEYLDAGVRLVWVIYPTTGQVLVYNSAGGKILSSHDELSGEDVIPDFRLKISELLRKPGE